MAFTARAALLTALIGLSPVLAQAQSAPPTTPPATTGAAQAPAPGTTPADGTTAPAASASAPVVVPATGFGWSTTPKKHAPRTGRPWVRAPRAPRTPDAILPGFETLADGSTRLFVQLSRPVEYVAKPAPGTLTYVLKGAHVDRRNNFNPLVTVHFNTPVSSARLVPHGRDLWFLVDLRASVSPSVTMEAAKDGGAMLRIEFPRGDYLPGQTASALPSTIPPAPTPATDGPSSAPAGPASGH